MRRERFVEELESYSKQLEEFQSFGDMQEIQRYLKKAQALNQRLESASEKVIIILQSVFMVKLLTMKRPYQGGDPVSLA